MEEQRCLKCGHEWISRVQNPKACPNCQTRNWMIKDYRQCTICGRNFLNLHLHHIDGNHENNQKINLILICGDCHSAIHSGTNNRKRRTRDFRSYNDHLIIKLNDYRKKLKTEK